MKSLLLSLLLLFAQDTKIVGPVGISGPVKIPAGTNSLIAFDFAPASVTTAAAATTISWNHTVGGGSHPVLLVGVEFSVNTTCSCTFNSVSMTEIGHKSDGAASATIYAFILAGPATGTHSVSCTLGASKDVSGNSVSFTGVNQTGTVGNTWRTASTVNDGGSGTATISNTVSNAVSGDMVVDFAAELSNTMTVDASQTQAFYIHRPLGNGVDFGSSYKSASGSTTMKWSITASSFWTSVGAALIPG